MTLTQRCLLLLALVVAPLGLRAQVTEVPQTIEPGGIQLRADALSFGVKQDTSAPNQYRALGVGTVLLSAGITQTVDAEVGDELFVNDTFTTNGSSHSQSGMGELSFRAKWRFFDDSSSGQSAAIIPYVMQPMNASVVGTRKTQGGIIMPWAVNVAGGFKVGAMIEWDELRNAADTRYDTRWYGSALAQWELGSRVSAYGEATLSTSTAGAGSDTGSLGAGATLNLNGNFQWDFEISKNLGTGRNAWTEVIRFRWKLL
jgi:Putative MetA-pathway of phenol degradation